LTVTLADAWVVPPEPEHDNVYVVVAVGDKLELPLSALAPLQPLLAVQESAFVLFQVKVDEPPEVMVVWFADNVTVGAGVGAGALTAVTVILVEACALPPEPVQESP